MSGKFITGPTQSVLIISIIMIHLAKINIISSKGTTLPFSRNFLHSISIIEILTKKFIRHNIRVIYTVAV